MTQIDTNGYAEGPLTNRLIGIAFKTYNTIGAGFAEKIYQNVFRDYLDEEKIKYDREKYAKLIVNKKIAGLYKIDFLIKKKWSLK